MMPSNYNNRTQQGPPVVLNVAEKPSVAKALAAVFNRMPESRDVVQSMPRDEAQIFTQDNVLFPDVYSQGNNNNNNPPPQQLQQLQQQQHTATYRPQNINATTPVVTTTSVARAGVRGAFFVVPNK
mmetsp:Transcript_40254/g.45985  ORF Transcript_40254/g.45985 Transcript_40254/m.45985 type:complete len:126 (-) Transcript_40254:147-524(-)